MSDASEQKRLFKQDSPDDFRPLTLLCDFLISVAAALLVSGSLYYFSNYNHFAPGGVTGLSSILATLITETSDADMTPYMTAFMLLFNLPIFILVAIFVSKKTGLMLSVYLVAQAFFLMLFKKLHTEGYLSYYDALSGEGNNLVFASIGVGVISGFGFSFMLRRFGASGGTYAITALIKKFHPMVSLAWFSFFLDASVVFLSVFVYRSGINPVISTLLNIFISDLVVDFMLQGLKSGYKFEIVTDNAAELSAELMTTLGRGVTTLHAEGMYTHSDKTLLICIVRKRQVGEFLKILKKYKASFAYSCKVNEIYGNFKK